MYSTIIGGEDSGIASHARPATYASLPFSLHDLILLLKQITLDLRML